MPGSETVAETTAKNHDLHAPEKPSESMKIVSSILQNKVVRWFTEELINREQKMAKRGIKIGQKLSEEHRRRQSEGQRAAAQRRREEQRSLAAQVLELLPAVTDESPRNERRDLEITL